MTHEIVRIEQEHHSVTVPFGDLLLLLALKLGIRVTWSTCKKVENERA